MHLKTHNVKRTDSEPYFTFNCIIVLKGYSFTYVLMYVGLCNRAVIGGLLMCLALVDGWTCVQRVSPVHTCIRTYIRVYVCVYAYVLVFSLLLRTKGNLHTR